jgi:PRTRC genetic system protein C
MTATTTPREFLWCGATLADPDPGLSAVQVRDIYATQFPELATASVGQAKEQNGRQVIEFTKKVGTKG